MLQGNETKSIWHKHAPETRGTKYIVKEEKPWLFIKKGRSASSTVSYVFMKCVWSPSCSRFYFRVSLNGALSTWEWTMRCNKCLLFRMSSAHNFLWDDRSRKGVLLNQKEKRVYGTACPIKNWSVTHHRGWCSRPQECFIIKSLHGERG